MRHGDVGARVLPRDPRRNILDRLHAVVQIEDLPAACKLAPDGFADDDVVMLEHIGLHGQPILRRLIQHGHVADAAHRHIQRARDRRCRQRQHINVLRHLLEFFLLRNAEALLLVHDEQTEILELHVGRNDAVRADDHIGLTAL